MGFGGKYGVQSDRVDKSAHKFEDKSELEHHPSQKGVYECVQDNSMNML